MYLVVGTQHNRSWGFGKNLPTDLGSARKWWDSGATAGLIKPALSNWGPAVGMASAMGVKIENFEKIGQTVDCGIHHRSPIF
jgi:hypothetical protein